MPGAAVVAPAPLPARQAVLVFLAFAFAYFLSALLRAVTATLAPVLSTEMQLGAAQLGLLAGAYFIGFSAMQLPLGGALDRFGVRRVLLLLLGVAAAGCAAFALARTIEQLLLARLLIGVGVSACLMAPLTLFRRRFDPTAQLRANSWMLMTGSFGMMASTLPTQWLLPWVGWRGLFALAAAAMLAAVALMAWAVPSDDRFQNAGEPPLHGFAQIFGHPAFRRLAPAGFFSYGGMIAMQSLWIGPWLTEVGRRTPDDAAAGLFAVNGSMLLAFLGWGLVMPRLARAGWLAEHLIARAWPLGAVCLAWIVWRGQAAGPFEWSLWCVLTSVVTLSLPAMAQAFDSALAGRALTAFNLVIFSGVFAVQWGLGLVIDALRGTGWDTVAAYQAAFGAYLGACIASFAWMHWRGVQPFAR